MESTSRAHTTAAPPGHFRLTCPGTPFWGVIDVGPDGEVFVSGRGITVAKSTTLQDPANPAAFDFATVVNLDGNITSGGGPNPGGLLGQAWIATNHADNEGRGEVYVLASVTRSSAPDPLDVMFARSTDGGVTWTAPLRINDDDIDNGAYQWFGTLSVAPNGRLDVVWLDTRNDPGGVLSQLYFACSQDGGRTWSENFEVSPQFDPHIGWPDQNKMGDYFDMISDDEGANLAWAGTFNGEQDVYFTRIPSPLLMGLLTDVPELLPPGEPFDLTVKISPGAETVQPGSTNLVYRYDNGMFIEVPARRTGRLPVPGNVAGPLLRRGTRVLFHRGRIGQRTGDAPGRCAGKRFQHARRPAQPDLRGQLRTGPRLERRECPGPVPPAVRRGLGAGRPRSTARRGDPPFDFDGSGQCYLTANRNVPDCNSDVDFGYTNLISPTLDLTTGDLTVRYAVWYTNNFGNSPNSDLFNVFVSDDDGQTWVEVDQLGPISSAGWKQRSFLLADVIQPTATMKIRFEASDTNEASVVEAAIDAFAITETICEPVYGNGDFDSDGDVDLEDFASFQGCFGGLALGGCEIGNLAGTETIGLEDFEAFVSLLTGP